MHTRSFLCLALLATTGGAQAQTTAHLNWVFEAGLKLNLDAYDLLNTRASQIDYYYTSRLPGEAAEGVADRHFHPVEPLAVRLTLAKAF